MAGKASVVTSLPTSVSAGTHALCRFADFLEGELQKTSELLQQKEKELGEIRSRYIQDLPESEQFHIQEA